MEKQGVFPEKMNSVKLQAVLLKKVPDCVLNVMSFHAS